MPVVTINPTQNFTVRTTVNPTKNYSVRGTTTFVGSANIATEITEICATANAASYEANVAYIYANSVYQVANSAAIEANVAYSLASAVSDTANTALSEANTAYYLANNSVQLVDGNIDGGNF